MLTVQKSGDHHLGMYKALVDNGINYTINWCGMFFINLPKDADWFTVSQFALNIFQGLTRNDVNQPLTTTMESLEFAEVVCDWTFVNAAVIISSCVLQLLCFAEWRLQTNWSGWFQNCVKASKFWCLKNRKYCHLLRHYSTRCLVLFCQESTTFCVCFTTGFLAEYCTFFFHVTIYKPTKPPRVSTGWSWVLFPINWWASVGNCILLDGQDGEPTPRVNLRMPTNKGYR